MRRGTVYGGRVSGVFASGARFVLATNEAAVEIARALVRVEDGPSARLAVYAPRGDAPG